jgi:ParB family transcriptional regulator, chromosome partitioning protein
MTRRALGRGLSALLADPVAESEPRDEELLEVDIDLIDTNPEQPRLNFSEAKLEELAQSIKINGLVQPILLRRAAAGRYQIVAGERRWRAAQRVGLRKVKAVIRNIPDAKLLELALIENIQRQELNPIEEAQAYQRLIQTLNLTQDEVAKQVGKDRSSVANTLRLLKLPTAVQKMLEDELLAMGHARALLGLEAEEQQLKLAQAIVNGRLSVREVEKAVKQMTQQAAPATTSTPVRSDANIRAAELKMKRFLGTQVRIISGQNRGKIEIEFSSMSELDRLYSVIMQKANQ